MARLIFLAFLLLLSSIVAEPISLLMEHRFGTAENWKKRGTLTVSLNPDSMKYKLENVEEEPDLGADKKSLEVFSEDVYSIRLLRGSKIVTTTSVSACEALSNSLRGKLEVISDDKGNIMASKFVSREQSKSLVVSFTKLSKEDIARPKYMFDAYTVLGHEIKVTVEQKEEPGFLKKYVAHDNLNKVVVDAANRSFRTIKDDASAATRRGTISRYRSSRRQIILLVECGGLCACVIMH